MTDEEWHALVKGMLRGEMARRGVTYEQLVAKLAEIGVKEEPKNVRNKVARGGFSAVFLVQCLRAMGCRQLQID
jgi:3-mercaptopyruvate sulfurtransferase SseA